MMRNYEKTWAALLAAAVLCSSSAASVWAADLTVTSAEDLKNTANWTIDNKPVGAVAAPVENDANHIVISGNGNDPDLSGYFNLYAGYVSGDGDAVSGNTMTVKSGTVNNLYGGYVSGNGAAEKNTVTFAGGTAWGALYGGGSLSGAAAENALTVTDGSIGGGSSSTHLYGGYSQTGRVAKDNTVTVSGGTVGGGTGMVYVYGGYAGRLMGNTNSMDISGNVVSISGNVDLMANGFTIAGGYAQSHDDGQETDRITGNTVKIENGSLKTDSHYSGMIYGGYANGKSPVTNNSVIVNGGTIELGGWGGIFGGRAVDGLVSKNQVTISGGSIAGKLDMIEWPGGGTVTAYAAIHGGYASGTGAVQDNTVTLSGGTVFGSVYGGYSEKGMVSGNQIILKQENGASPADLDEADLYGSNLDVSETNSGNNLVVDNWSGTVGGLHNFAAIDFQNVAMQAVTGETDYGHTLTLDAANGNVSGMDRTTVKVTSLSGLTAGDVAAGTTYRATVTWDDAIQAAAADVSAVTGSQWLTSDRNEGGLYVNQYDTDVKENGSHKVVLESSVTASALTGKFIDTDGTAHYNAVQSETSHPLVISEGFTTNVDTVAGAYAVGSQNATGGQLYITGNPADGFTKTVYAGYSESGNANGNDVYIGNADHAVHADRVILRGDNGNGSDNTLHVTGMGNTLGSVANFDALSFEDIVWQNGGTILSIEKEDEAGRLTDTAVSVNGLSLAGGTTLSAGQSMTLLASTKDMGLGDAGDIPLNGADDFTAGVAAVGKGTMAISEDGKQLTYTIDRVGLNPQTLTIAENRTAAAAFLNQGADIAADSLDLLGSDYKYGLRTFGAVYGSRSTYDAAGDLKINGWSEIVGLGNVHRKGDGDLSWGVFYENGTGNYRTWNEFNNEMFRGDGSLLYNGGGAAVRYKQDNGWYYEASVRAGILSASMDNAVKDGKGNSYGFDSDSTYWGAHAGVGKVIETEQGEWNVYGKYFHTDIDGDSFNIAGDAFTFDSLTSDRLRIGARYTADKAKRWSLYYGLAWEYEFSGDSHMKAGQWDAPEQSLGGSTGIAEIGTVWQPDDSPWQANINLKGYAGEREGFSGMVQLAYTF